MQYGHARVERYDRLSTGTTACSHINSLSRIACFEQYTWNVQRFQADQEGMLSTANLDPGVLPPRLYCRRYRFSNHVSKVTQLPGNCQTPITNNDVLQPYCLHFCALISEHGRVLSCKQQYPHQPFTKVAILHITHFRNPNKIPKGPLMSAILRLEDSRALSFIMLLLWRTACAVKHPSRQAPSCLAPKYPGYHPPCFSWQEMRVLGTVPNHAWSTRASNTSSEDKFYLSQQRPNATQL